MLRWKSSAEVSAPDALSDCSVERSLSRKAFGRGDQGVDPFRRCAPGVEVGRGEEPWVRINARGAMESVAVVAMSGRSNVQVPAPRSSGAIRSDRAAAQV